MATNWVKITVEYEKHLLDVEAGSITEKMSYTQFAKKKKLNPGTLRNQVTKLSRERREAGIPLGSAAKLKAKKKITGKPSKSSIKTDSKKAPSVTKSSDKKRTAEESGKSVKKITGPTQKKPKKSDSKKGESVTKKTSTPARSKKITGSSSKKTTKSGSKSNQSVTNCEDENSTDNSKSGTSSNGNDRIDWERFRIIWLRSDFKHLVGFALFHGIDPHSGTFKRKTKGWVAQKKEMIQLERESATSNFSTVSVKGIHTDKCLMLNEIKNHAWALVQNLPKISFSDAGDIEKITKSVKTACELVVCVSDDLHHAIQEKLRVEFIEKYKSDEISVLELAALCELNKIPFPKVFEPAYKEAVKEEPPSDYDGFDPAQVEEEDAIADQETKQVLHLIRTNTPAFKEERAKEVAEIKKELTPKKDPYNQKASGEVE